MKTRWVLALDWDAERATGRFTVRRVTDGIPEELYSRQVDAWTAPTTFWKAASVLGGDARLDELPAQEALFD